MKKIIGLLLCFVVFETVAYCDSFTKDWHWTYRGNIVGETGGLTLVYDQNSVIGKLYFDSDYVDILVSGTLDGRRIILKADNGLIIDALFQEYDTRYGDSKLDREIIKGKIYINDVDGDIYLDMNYGSAGGLDSMYAIGGIDNDEMVDGFAQEFKKAVLDKDKETVADMIYYPLRIDSGEIQDKNEFILKFNEIFYPEFFEAFKKAIPKNMFSKYSGVMMSSDDNVFWIWISGNNENTSVISIFTDRIKLGKNAEK